MAIYPSKDSCCCHKQLFVKWKKPYFPSFQLSALQDFVDSRLQQHPKAKKLLSAGMKESSSKESRGKDGVNALLLSKLNRGLRQKLEGKDARLPAIN